MLVTGSSAGLVKLWDLAGLLASPPILTPLRRISMKVIIVDLKGQFRRKWWER
jgi:hypothetical protein